MPPQTPHATTAQEVHVLFESTGYDAIWALYVLLAVALSAFVFMKAYNMGAYFFQDEELKV